MTNEPSLQARLDLANKEIKRLGVYEDIVHSVSRAFRDGLMKIHNDQLDGLQPTAEGLLNLIKESWSDTVANGLEGIV